MEAGQAADAQRSFEAAARADPKSAAAANYVGRALIAQGKWDDALPWMEKAVALEDTSAAYHLWLGRALGQKAAQANIISKGMLAPKVREQFERAVALDPELLDAREDLLSFYIRAPAIMGGGIDKAMVQAGEIKKRHALRGHSAFATIYASEKKPEKVEAEWLAAIRDLPAAPEPRYLLGLHYQGQKRWEDALRLFEEATPLEKDRSTSLYQIGRNAVLSGLHLDRGAEALQKFLAQPERKGEAPHAWAHYRLGQIRLKQGKKDVARQEFETTQRLDPKHPEVAKALKDLK